MRGEQLKITVLMPTFNDALFIAHAIESVLQQTYPYWDLLIFDDGSTDETRDVIRRFASDSRIKYFRGDYNQDQLNALYHLLPHVSGDVVTLLHSDDMFKDKDALYRIYTYFKDHHDLDGVYADLVRIDAAGTFKGWLKTPNVLSNNAILKAFLSLGTNVIGDLFCVRKNVFFDYIMKTYILWNILYWLVFLAAGVRTLKLLKIEPWYQYRIGDNYLARPNEARRAFVLSGCYRTLIELSFHYYVTPTFVFVTRFPKSSKLVRMLPTAFAKKADGALETLYLALRRNSCLLVRLLSKYKITDRALKIFFEAPIEYMLSMEQNKLLLDVSSQEIEEQRALFGKDARVYYDGVLSGMVVISSLYRALLTRTKEIKAVRVLQPQDVVPMRNILRFLNLPLPILVKPEGLSSENLCTGFRRRFSWE